MQLYIIENIFQNKYKILLFNLKKKFYVAQPGVQASQY